MDFGKQCSAELEKSAGGHWRDNSLYFTLKEINQLPNIIKRLNYIEETVRQRHRFTKFSPYIPYIKSYLVYNDNKNGKTS